MSSGWTSLVEVAAGLHPQRGATLVARQSGQFQAVFGVGMI